MPPFDSRPPVDPDFASRRRFVQRSSGGQEGAFSLDKARPVFRRWAIKAFRHGFDIGWASYRTAGELRRNVLLVAPLALGIFKRSAYWWLQTHAPAVFEALAGGASDVEALAVWEREGA